MSSGFRRRFFSESDTQDSRLAPALSAALVLLGQRRPGAAPTVIKPSNWANNLGPLLRAGNIAARIVLVTIERLAFLRAAFRGGRDRLGFNARTAAHSAVAAGASDLLSMPLRGSLDQAARPTLLAHALQGRLFDHLTRAVRGGGPDKRLTKRSLASHSSPPDEALATAIERLQLRDSKHPDRTFSAAGQIIEDAEVERYHATRFDRALSWPDRAGRSGRHLGDG